MTMKKLPFKFEMYRKGGYKVVTKDGIPVYELHQFETTPGVIHGVIDGARTASAWDMEGRNIYETMEDRDLRLVQDIKPGWVNVFVVDNRVSVGAVWDSEAEAMEVVNTTFTGKAQYIKTIKITAEV
jgi:hypothetical protein